MALGGNELDRYVTKRTSMKLIQIDEKKIKGLSVRTNNASEAKPETSKIGGLWQRFYSEISPKLNNGATVFGVYFDYESDASGEFSVLAGSDEIVDQHPSDAMSVSIQSGNYLLFKSQGDMPQIVIDTWSEVWKYFESNNAEYKRAYTTDFELYKSANEIEIYIAVQ